MSAAPRPYTLVAELTYRCPLRCVYCSNPVDFHRSRAELSTDDWKRVFSQAAELGVMQLHLSGGEPVLRDDLTELIRHARAHDLYTNLITGGTLLDEDKLRRFREAGLDHIQLSIQGAARESAETIAGVRSHRKKLDVARLIGKIGFPLTLNVVIHRMNIAEVPELIGLALELGANRLELANTQFYAWAAENRRALMPTHGAVRSRRRNRAPCDREISQHARNRFRAERLSFGRTQALHGRMGPQLHVHQSYRPGHAVPRGRCDSLLAFRIGTRRRAFERSGATLPR